MSITPTRRLLIVSIQSQSMALIIDREIKQIYQISTSKNPPSCLADSYGTPTGLHQLADFIGADAPSGMVFKGRMPTGRLFTEYPPEAQQANLITSRIIRLRGLEKNKNSGASCDSYERYIYLHGTNHEDRIGTPFSAGCIEMRNAAIIELFDQVAPGDLFVISEQ